MQNRPEGNGGLGYPAIGSVKAYEIHVRCLLNDSLFPLESTQIMLP